jgi:hypothetical protein
VFDVLLAALAFRFRVLRVRRERPARLSLGVIEAWDTAQALHGPYGGLATPHGPKARPAGKVLGESLGGDLIA